MLVCRSSFVGYEGIKETIIGLFQLDFSYMFLITATSPAALLGVHIHVIRALNIIL